jgi:hypothetical protein
MLFLSATAFGMAVIMDLGMAAGLTFRTGPEGFSRASNNLALIAIALAVISPLGEDKGSRR